MQFLISRVKRSKECLRGMDLLSNLNLLLHIDKPNKSTNLSRILAILKCATV